MQFSIYNKIVIDESRKGLGLEDAKAAMFLIRRAPKLQSLFVMPLDNTSPEWMDLKALTSYACVSEKTLRTWIHSPKEPLPAYQRGNKIYVRRREFDAWLQQHSVSKKSVEIERVVEDIVKSMGA
jgi:hypothetical protein